jgi:hypothetical protein
MLAIPIGSMPVLTNPPPADSRLTLLISKLERGETLDLSLLEADLPRSPNAMGEVKIPNRTSATELSADWLRMILIGLPFSFPGESNTGESVLRPVRVTSAGVRVKAATITGKLNLDDLAGAGSAALPALHFDNCVFENETFWGHGDRLTRLCTAQQEIAYWESNSLLQFKRRKA